MAIAFYCLGTLDLTGHLERKMSTTDRENWTEWIWAQYVGTLRSFLPGLMSRWYYLGGGFRSGPSVGSDQVRIYIYVMREKTVDE